VAGSIIVVDVEGTGTDAVFTFRSEPKTKLPDLPPVDVLVRTSGELRISNFMLWQSVGARVYFTDKTWPEFDAAELDAALSLVAH
jgi:undecaprenyl diphosphate synthase